MSRQNDSAQSDNVIRRGRSARRSLKLNIMPYIFHEVYGTRSSDRSWFCPRRRDYCWWKGQTLSGQSTYLFLSNLPIQSVLFIYLSICFSIYLSIYMSILSICLSIYLYLSFYPSKLVLQCTVFYTSGRGLHNKIRNEKTG